MGILSFLFIIGGFVLYTKGFSFKVGSIRLCRNGNSFFYQYKKLVPNQHSKSYSYGEYSSIWIRKSKSIHNIKKELQDIFLNDDSDLNNENQNAGYYSYGFNLINEKLYSMDKFKYEQEKYLITGYINRKDCMGMLCREVGDTVDVMIFDKDNLQPLAGGEIAIAKGNPRRCGKGESVEGKPYRYVSKKDLENIIMLVFQDDLK